MATKRTDYNVLHINAAPGNPSTFWVRRDAQGDWAKFWYRTRKDADLKINPVNPPDFQIQKTFWQKNKDIIFSIAVVLAVAAIVWYLTNPKQLKAVPKRFEYIPPKVQIND